MNYCSVELKLDGLESEFTLLAKPIINMSSKEELVDYIKNQMLNLYLIDEDHIVSKQDIINALITLKDTIIGRGNIGENEIQSIITNFNSLFSSYSENVGTEEKDRLNFENRARLFPVLNSALNQYLFTELNRDLFRFSVYDASTGTILKTRQDLNTAIMNYKNALFHYLIDFIKSENNSKAALDQIGDGDLYDPLGDSLLNGDVYESIMRIARNKISSMTLSGPINSGISLKTITDVLNPIKAYYVLNNFDEFIDAFSNGDILVSPQLRGKLDNFGDKYTHKKQLGRQKSFSDDAKSVDASDITGKLFLGFIQSIEKNVGDYCTPYDLNALFKHLHNLIDEDAVFTSYKRGLADTISFRSIVNSRLSAEQRAEIILSALEESPEIKKRLGENVAKALYDALSKYKELYKSTFNRSSLKDRHQLSMKYDWANQLLHEVLTHQPSAYVSVTPEGVKTKSVTKVLRGKEYIVSDLKSRLKDSITLGQWLLYNPRYVIGNSNKTIATFNDIYSAEFLNYVQRLTGINLASENLITKLLNPANSDLLAQFLVAYNRMVRNDILPYRYSDNIDSIIDQAFSKFQKTSSEYVAFTNLLISDNSNDNVIIHNQSGDVIPTQNVPNTIGDFSKNLTSFNIQMKGKDGRPVQTLFHMIPNLVLITSKENAYSYTDRIYYRLDYAFGKGKQVVAARALTAGEIMTTALNNDFLEGVLKYRTFFNQLECVSDKPRIPVCAFNIDATYNGKKFYELTTKELHDLYYEQHANYYSQIRDNLIVDYNKLFGTTFATLELCIQKLESLHKEELKELAGDLINIDQLENYDRLSKKDLKKLLKNYNLVNVTSFTNLKDCLRHYYSLGYLRLYKLLKTYNQHNPTSRIELNDQIHYVNTKKGLRFNNTLYYSIACAENRALLNEALDDGLADTFNFIKENKIPLVADLSDTDLLQDLFKGDVLPEEVRAFFKKSTWAQVDAKGNLTETAKKIIGKWFIMQLLCTDADLMVSIKLPYIHEQNNNHHKIFEISKLSDSRTFKEVDDKILKDMKKEMSARMTKGKKRNNAAVASYEPMLQDVPFGVGKNMKIAVVGSMESKLYTYNGVSLYQKVHDGGTYTNGIHAQFEECSFPGKDYQGTKKTIGLFPRGNTFTQLKHAEFIITNALIRDSYINPDDQHYNFGKIFEKCNRVASIEQLINNYNATPEENRPELGYEVYKKINGKLHKLTSFDLNTGIFTWEALDGSAIISESNVLNTVYDLWKAFGGENSRSINEDGQIVLSEISQIITADLISTYAPKIKEDIVAKVADVSAVKSGVSNLNPQSTMFDDSDFEYFSADTSRMGIQQDYTHEADESLIPALTQVLTALAFNGENIELCNSIYEDLGKIMENSLRSLKLAWNKSTDHKDFHIKLAKDLLESLKNSVVSSNAIDIVKETVESALAEELGKGTFKQLPYSSPEIFNKITSDFISGLNSNSLRQKFAGIAIIQNPSHGIIGMYEDHFGNRYTRTELIEYGEELGIIGDNNTVIQLVLRRPEFQDVKINSANDITIGDWVFIVSEAGGQHLEIKTPEELIYINDLITSGEAEVYRHFQKQRDLKPTTITFTDDSTGERKSLWMLESTLKKIADPKNKQNVLYFRANLRALGNKENPGYYKTYDDYIKGILTPISNLVYKPGEQILPKVNKSVQHLYDSLNKIKRVGPKYFAEKVRLDIVIEQIVRADSKDGFALNLVTKDNEFAYTDNLAPENAQTATIENSLIVEEDGHFYLTNYAGEEIIEVPSNQVLFTTKVLNNGKTQIVIYVAPEDRAAVAKIASENKDVTAYYDGGKFRKFCERYNDLDLSTPKTIEKSILEQAKKMYYSFLVSNYTISARIPSQAFQSFTANETVSFIEDGSNNGYVNVYEIIFLGSDFDIDKAYTMMYEMDNTGKIAGTSPLFQYDSVLAILDSFKLNNPNSSLFISYKEISKDLNGNIRSGSDLTENEKALPEFLNRDSIFREFLLRWGIDPEDNGDLQKVTTFDTLSTFSESLPGNAKVRFYNDLLDTLKIFSEGKRLVYLTEYTETSFDEFFRILDLAVKNPQSNKLINLLNRHNMYKPTTKALKNRIMHGVYAIATDIHNLESAQLLMEMDTMMDTITRVEKTSPGKSNSGVYSYFSPITKYKIQLENSVGKDNVGIAANGVKADGAIQLYFNYSLLKSPVVANKLLTDVDLQFNAKNDLEYKPLFSKRFVRFANVKMTKELFLQLCNNKSFETDADFIAINTLLKEGVWDKHKSPYYYDNYDEEEGKVVTDRDILNPYYLNLLDEWTLYNKQHKIKNELTIEQYKDFLWYRTQFEENAADQLSVFISLATDNAKVLALARLNATPELMSLPLAMISLGMDSYSTVNVCINLLDAIANRMSQNRFTSNGKRLNVRDVILKLGEEKVYDEATTTSLLRLYDFAQELRAITSFYKVNLGVDSKYEKLLSWVNGLSRLKLERDKVLSNSLTIDGVSVLSSIALIENEDGSKRYADIVGKPIDFNKMFSDPDYAKRLSEYCDLTKVGINYIDIILNSPNFREQLSGVNFALQSVQKISFVAGLTQTLLGDAFDDSLYSEEYSTEDTPEILDNLTSSDYNIYTKIKDIARHIIIADMLKNKVQYAFKISDIESVFGKTTLNLGINTVFDFTTYQGTNAFVKILTDTIIPTLMTQYKDNFFMLSLDQKEDWNTKQKLWVIKYNPFNSENKSEIANINQAKILFETIMQNGSGLKTVDGQEITIGELFFLYDLITKKSAVSALNTAVRSGISLYSNLPNLLDLTYREYDTITQKGDILTIINNIGYDKLNAIVQALKNESKTAVVNGKEINLKDGWFYTEVPFVWARSVGDFDNSIKQLFTEINGGELTTNYTLKDGILHILATIKQGNRSFNYFADIDGIQTTNSDPRSIPLSKEQVKVLTNEILANTKSITDILVDLPISSENTFTKVSDLKGKYKGSVIDKILKTIPNESSLIVVENGKEAKRRVNRSFTVRQGNLSYVIMRLDALIDNVFEIYDVLLEVGLVLKGLTPTIDQKVNALIASLDDSLELSQLYLENIKKLSKKNLEIVNNYIYYLNQLSIDESFKKLCLGELTLYRDKLLANPDVYYYSSYKDGTFNIGDRYVKDKVQYLYLGKKRGNNHTLIALGDEPSVVEADDLNLATYTKVAQIKRSPMYTLIKLNSLKYNYSDYQWKSIDDVNITDKVKIGTSEWIVSDIVYDLDKDNNYIKQLIITNGEMVKVIDGKNRIYSAKSDYEDISNTGQVKASADISPEVLDFYNPAKDLILGDKVIYRGKTYDFYNLLSENVIILKDENNNIIAANIKEITSILFFHAINPDKEFKLAMLPVQVIVSNSESKEVSLEIYPELFGYSQVELDNGKQKANSSLVTYEYLDEGWKVRNIYNHTLLADNSKILAGNIVILKTGAIENCYKIIADIGSSFIVYEITNSGEYNVKVLNKSYFDNTTIRIYSDNKEQIKGNISYNLEEVGAVDSMTQKGLTVVDQLEENFGVSTIFINDPNMKEFARLQDGNIIINLANKPNEMSKGEYIAKLALHEFTHLALANMLAQSPEAYYTLILAVRNLSYKALDNILGAEELILQIKSEIENSDVYDSITDKVEEVIVRYIERIAKFSDLTNELTFIRQALNNGFRQLFKLKSSTFSIEDNIASILGRYNTNFYEETTSDFNINFIRNESVLLKMYDNIKQIC